MGQGQPASVSLRARLFPDDPPSGARAWTLLLLAVVIAAFAVYTGWQGSLPQYEQRGGYFALIFALIFLARPFRKDAPLLVALLADVAIVLGGELAPHGLGRRVRAAAYGLLYGGSPIDRLPPPPESSLGLRWEIVATAHGRAMLLVGRKAA